MVRKRTTTRSRKKTKTTARKTTRHKAKSTRKSTSKKTTKRKVNRTNKKKKKPTRRVLKRRLAKTRAKKITRKKEARKTLKKKPKGVKKTPRPSAPLKLGPSSPEVFESPHSVSQKSDHNQPPIEQAVHSLPPLDAGQKTLVGSITGYYPDVEEASIRLMAPLKLGDTISIEGGTTGFVQKVEVMVEDLVPIDKAKAGDLVGVEVDSEVKEGDKVFKISK